MPTPKHSQYLASIVEARVRAKQIREQLENFYEPMLSEELQERMELNVPELPGNVRTFLEQTMADQRLELKALEKGIEEAEAKANTVNVDTMSVFPG